MDAALESYSRLLIEHGRNVIGVVHQLEQGFDLGHRFSRDLKVSSAILLEVDVEDQRPHAQVVVGEGVVRREVRHRQLGTNQPSAQLALATEMLAEEFVDVNKTLMLE